MHKYSNLIKNCILNNKKGFIINNNNKNLSNLKVFLKINVIKFIKIKDNKLIVYINYIKNKPIFKNILNLYKSSNKKYISCKKIKKKLKDNKCIFIISTNKGVINSFEAIKFNVGGILIAQIWN